MNIIKLNATESTNTYLKNLAREKNIPDKTIVVTDNQIQGRGQRENSWYSTSEGSLTFSIFKRFDNLAADNHFKISMAISIAVVRIMKEIGVDQTCLKWPNDIMSGNKKLGGILVENSLWRNTIKSTVIGIGININIESFPNLPQAGSIRISTGKTFDKDDLFQKLVEECLFQLNRVEQRSFSEWKEIYEKHLFRINQVSVFEESKTSTRFSGIIRGISMDGQLLIEKKDGIRKQVGVKELRLLF